MGQKDALGQFEHYVLLAAMRLGEDAFTAPIVHELESQTDRSVAPAAVYIALRRLEKKGLVSSRLRVDDSSGPKRERRFIEVTLEGREVLRLARSDFERLWAGVDFTGEEAR